MVLKVREVDADLQGDGEEVVEVGHPLELLKQRHGQEGQQGVLVAAHHIVLATSNTQTTNLNAICDA